MMRSRTSVHWSECCYREWDSQMKTKYFYFIALQFLISSQLTAQKRFNSLDSLFNQYERNDDFNGVVLIARNGEVVFSRSVGYADFEKQIGLDLNTPMHLASNSKVFTNMCVMILSEQRLLKYDDKVKKYIKDFPYNNITIRHLMTMTSGLKRLYNKDTDGDGIMTNKELMDYLLKKKPKLSFPPGDQHQSSVVGYCILAEVIEEVTKKPFITFINEEIFQPLKMDDTFIVSKDNLNLPRAISYDKKNKEKEWFLGSYIGGVSIYASALDMLKWDQAHYTNQLISQEAISMAYERMKFNDGKFSHVTLGSWMRWNGQENLIFKNGDWVANNSILFRDIENNTTVIIMNNRQNRITKFDLMDAILPKIGYQL